MTSSIGNNFQFEAHGGYGSDDFDGEPWPFGYISTSPTPQPVFELNVVLGFDAEELRALALKMAAAAEIFAELKRMIDHFGIWANDHSEEATTETWAALHCAKAAILKAEPAND